MASKLVPGASFTDASGQKKTVNAAGEVVPYVVSETGGDRLKALSTANDTGTGTGSVIASGGNGLIPPTPTDYTEQINNMYGTMQTNKLNALRMAQERAANQLRQQKETVAPQYRTQRNATDTQNVISADRLREAMAANGIRGGQNMTVQAGLQTSRQQALADLNMQEQATLNDYDQRIGNIYNAGDEVAINAEVEAARAQALLNAQMNQDNQAYSRYRDLLGDTRYVDERDYGRGRDTLGDTERLDERAYGRGRDVIADQKYYDERGYQRGRDTIADQRQDALIAYNQGRDKEADKRYYDEQAWARSANNPQVKAQILANQINEITLQNLPEQTRLQLEQLRRTIDQIGRQPAKDPVQAQIQQVELDTAKERLKALQGGGGDNAQDIRNRAISLAQKDPDWMGATPAKQSALVKRYEGMIAVGQSTSSTGGQVDQGVQSMISNARQNGYTDAQIRQALVDDGIDPSQYGI